MNKKHEPNNPEWINWMVNELKNIYQIEKRPPTTSMLSELGRGDILGGIRKSLRETSHDLVYYLNLAGINIEGRYSRIWTWNKLSTEIEKISVIKNGFPRLEMIKEELGSGAEKAIRKLGGIRAVCDRMGYKYNRLMQARDGHLLRSVSEYIFDEFLYSCGIPHEVDGKISDERQYRYDFKVGNIYFEIWGYPERFSSYILKKEIKTQLYQKLKLKLVSIEAEEVFSQSLCFVEQYLKDLLDSLNLNTNYVIPFNIDDLYAKCGAVTKEYVVASIIDIIANTGNFPTETYLRKIGNHRLIHLIGKYYGGFRNLRKEFNIPQAQRENGWATVENVKEEILEIMKDTGGVFPSYNYLLKNDKSYLSRAISRLGGFNKFKKLLNVPLDKHSIVYDQEVVNKAIDLHNRGMSQRKISKIVKANPVTIRRWIKKANV